MPNLTKGFSSLANTATWATSNCPGEVTPISRNRIVATCNNPVFQALDTATRWVRLNFATGSISEMVMNLEIVDANGAVVRVDQYVT